MWGDLNTVARYDPLRWSSLQPIALVLAELQSYSTTIEQGTCVWKLTGSGPYLDFPHYFDDQLQPVDASEVPPGLYADIQLSPQ